MNWEEEVISLYQKSSNDIGKISYRGEIPYTLCPIYHNTAAAQIEVTIDQEGMFLRGERVDEEDRLTIIPVTEKSDSRTSGDVPHPLCDKLKYVAGDYKNYCSDGRECYKQYMEQLEAWYQSDYCHPKVRAVYHYLKKGTLMQDLIKNKQLKLTDKGELDKKEKIQKADQNEAMVRFIVRSTVENLDAKIIPDECWRDSSLWECYITYRRSLEQQKEICYMTGHLESPTYLHPRRIRGDGDGAKLISANDSTGFTYRGRFATKEEAFSVGSESSQMFHNALKWIIRKQGERFNTLTMVTWESVTNAPVGRWDVDAETLVSDYERNYEEEEEDDYGYDEDEWEEEKASEVNEPAALAFNRAMNGYQKSVSNTSHMILLALDASTKGRNALFEYKHLDTARYLKNIRKWHEDCWWIHEKRKNGKWIHYYGMVGIRDIVNILFGIEIECEGQEELTIVDSNGKRMCAETAKRLLPCIWDGRDIPSDYVNRAVERASMPYIYKDRHNWERVLTLACSMVKKQRKQRNNKEEWTMKLKEDCTDRNYLYGRLLAVADRIEYRTYDKDTDKMRVTNAKRYMNTFSQRPFETWKMIEENVLPYLNKLEFSERRYYENVLHEIFELFGLEEFKDNKKLDGLYLLGFHHQSYKLKNNYKKDQSEEE